MKHSTFFEDAASPAPHQVLHVVLFRVFTPEWLLTKIQLSSWCHVEITLGGCCQSEGFSRIYSTVDTGSALSQHCLSWTFSGEGGEGGRPPIDGQGHGTPSPHPRPSLRLYPPVFMGEQQFNQPNTKCVNPEMMMSERVCRQHKHLVSLPWFTMIHYQQQLRFRALAFLVRMICG